MSVFTFHAYAAPDTADLRAKIQAASCEQFLTREAIPAIPGPTPEPRLTGWSRLLHPLRAHRLTVANRDHAVVTDAHAAYQTRLQAKREQIAAAIASSGTEQLDNAHLDPAASTLNQELEAKVAELITNATSLEQLDKIKDHALGKIAEVAELSKALTEAKAQAKAKIDQLIETAQKATTKEDLKTRAISGIMQIAAAGSLAEVRAARERLAAQLRESLVAEDEARRVREQRFDLDKLNAPRILEAFAALAPAAVTNLNREQVDAKMESDAELKKFVYDEMQLLRRLHLRAAKAGPEVAAKVQAGIEARLTNDVTVIHAALVPTIKGSMIAQTQLVRRGLTRLNQPKMLAGVAGAAGLRKLVSLEREAIVTDALQTEQLRAAILGSSLDLLTSVGAAPKPPTAPNQKPPPVPNIPKKVKTRSAASKAKRDIAAYKTAVASWQAAWKKFPLDYEHFRTVEFPAYQKQMTDLREAYARRAKARQAYVAFLAFKYPAFFSTPEMPAKLTEVYRQQTSASPNLFQARARQNATVVTSATSTSDSSGPELLDWILFYDTQNPMWLVDRDIAMWMLIFDWDKHSMHDVPTDHSATFGVDPNAAAAQAQDPSVLNAPGLVDPPPVQMPPVDAPVAPQDPGTPSDNGTQQLEAPVLTAPDLQDPTLATPGLPDLALPDTSLPDVTLPEFTMPTMPDIPNIPDIPIMPEIPEIPTFTMPDIQIETPTITDTFTDTSSSWTDTSSGWSDN